MDSVGSVAPSGGDGGSDVKEVLKEKEWSPHVIGITEGILSQGPRCGLIAGQAVIAYELIGTMCNVDMPSRCMEATEEYPYDRILQFVKTVLVTLPTGQRTLQTFAKQAFTCLPLRVTGTTTTEKAACQIPQYVLDYPEHIRDVEQIAQLYKISKATIVECWQYAYSRCTLYYHIDGQLGWYGSGWVSALNHSCNPNAFLYLNTTTGTMYVVANQHIKEGTEITINYFAHLPTFRLASWKERQRLIQLFYAFECHCSECELEKSFEVKLVSYSTISAAVADAERIKNTLEELYLKCEETINGARCLFEQHEQNNEKNEKDNNKGNESGDESSIAYEYDRVAERCHFSFLHHQDRLHRLVSLLEDEEDECKFTAEEKKTMTILTVRAVKLRQAMMVLQQSSNVQKIRSHFPWRPYIDSERKPKVKRELQRFGSMIFMEKWAHAHRLILTIDQDTTVNMAQFLTPVNYLVIRHMMISAQLSGTLANAVDKWNTEIKKTAPQIKEVMRAQEYSIVLQTGIQVHFAFASAIRDMQFVCLAIELWPRLVDVIERTGPFVFHPHTILAIRSSSFFSMLVKQK